MKISPLPLPSNPKTKVHFRVPTVDDAISIAELDPAYEESILNEFLKDIQDADKNKGKERFDPTEWTVEDRKMALLWIFAQSREDKTISVGYECATCKDTHYVDVNIGGVLEQATTISGPSSLDIEFHKGKEVYQATVSSLKGLHAEHLEQIRLERDEHAENSKEYRILSVKLAMAEQAQLFSIKGEPEEEEEAFEYKMQLLRSLALDTEFRSLASKIEQALRKMHHGVPVRYVDGKYLLIAQHPNCESAIAKGGSDSIELLVPFRPYEFIPKL